MILLFVSYSLISFNFYLFYFPGAAAEPLGSARGALWGSAEHRLGTSGLSRQVLDVPDFEDDVTTVSRNVGPHIPWGKKKTLRNRNINVNLSVVLSELSQ